MGSPSHPGYELTLPCGLMSFPDAEAHNAAGKPLFSCSYSAWLLRECLPSYHFPATPEALRCPSARMATWALRMSHPRFLCSPQPSLWQGLATNRRNESEVVMAEGPAAHPRASQRVCPSRSTTGDWALTIVEWHKLGIPDNGEISKSSHWKLCSGVPS